jgi:hypothetical protein
MIQRINALYNSFLIEILKEGGVSMKKGNIYKLKDLNNIYEIPTIDGYTIIENHVVDSFFKTLKSHSTDLYVFRLYKTNGQVSTLMYGSVVGSDSQLTAERANATYGKWLRNQLSIFASTAPQKVGKTNKTVIQTVDGATFTANRCRKGVIVGCWYNSNRDTDISLQMLAYILLNFAAINSVGAQPDNDLRHQTYDTIPNDSCFGKFDVDKAKSVFAAEMLVRHDRMVARCCVSS